MKVLMINNDGGGYAKHIELPDGMTMGELFTQHFNDTARAEDYLIRVNRLPAAQDHVLVEGDRVSVTPVKIEGATEVFLMPEAPSRDRGFSLGVLGRLRLSGGKLVRKFRKLISWIKGRKLAGYFATLWPWKANSGN